MPLLAAFADPPGALLVVANEPFARLRLREALVALGYAADSLAFTRTIAQTRAWLADEKPPVMALIDIDLPDGNGIALIDFIHARAPAVPVLAVADPGAGKSVAEAMLAGALGYILKKPDELEVFLLVRGALHSTVRGKPSIDPCVAQHMLRLAGGKTPAPTQQDFRPAGAAGKNFAHPVTPRETEILTLIAKGLSNQEIAHALALSSQTVAGHIKSIYKKLAVNSRTQAVFEARSNGLLT